VAVLVAQRPRVLVHAGAGRTGRDDAVGTAAARPALLAARTRAAGIARAAGKLGGLERDRRAGAERERGARSLWRLDRARGVPRAALSAMSFEPRPLVRPVCRPVRARLAERIDPGRRRPLHRHRLAGAASVGRTVRTDRYHVLPRAVPQRSVRVSGHRCVGRPGHPDRPHPARCDPYRASGGAGDRDRSAATAHVRRGAVRGEPAADRSRCAVGHALGDVHPDVRDRAVRGRRQCGLAGSTA
jgi:hypothetical protein